MPGRTLRWRLVRQSAEAVTDAEVGTENASGHERDDAGTPGRPDGRGCAAIALQRHEDEFQAQQRALAAQREREALDRAQAERERAEVERERALAEETRRRGGRPKHRTPPWHARRPSERLEVHEQRASGSAEGAV